MVIRTDGPGEGRAIVQQRGPKAQGRKYQGRQAQAQGQGLAGLRFRGFVVSRSGSPPETRPFPGWQSDILASNHKPCAMTPAVVPFQHGAVRGPIP